MNQEKINKYQDVYRQLWEIQMKKDRKANPKLDSISPNYKKKRASFNIVKDVSEEKVPKALTKQASTINMLLLRGFGIKEISAVIHTSEKAIVAIKERYDLPR
jgi:SOS response regulatory protein OraA/RecX|tara:strand:- start:451 stop:759 length:309 start_codon:yes stop_codon:yes gene_type:complete